ncbi:hypothetical protein B566_EDAN009274 [Ephemera danica]|nr:hypothetical protein B566_EDAN009274 [Ephemera danica]
MSSTSVDLNLHPSPQASSVRAAAAEMLRRVMSMPDDAMSTFSMSKTTVRCAPRIALLVLCSIATLASGDNLEASPDFHSVTLLWGDPTLLHADVSKTQNDHEAPISPAARAGTVVVTFCELQAWGPHRCKDKSVQMSRMGRVFSAQVNGLRMATRYSFQVRPGSLEVSSSSTSTHNVSPLATGLPASTITAQTKGFSARATLCLANSTEVEVDTGPFFGGRISVEPLNGTPGDVGPNSGADPEVASCSVWGDSQSTRATYRLRFDHHACGGTRALNSSAVATFLLVQESLPILTHSTRRFLVLCTAQPDTLTVSAGISLPGGVEPAPSSENSVAGASGSAEPQRVARLLRNPSVPPVMLPTLHEPRTQHLPHLQPRLAGSSGAQLVLMLALVSTVAVGSGFAAWWAVRRHRLLSTTSTSRRHDIDSSSTNAVTLSRSSSFSPEDYDDDFSITTYDNFAVTNTRSSESEASSAIHGIGDDVTSCSSVDSSCSSGSMTSSASDTSSSSSDDEPPMQILVLQEPQAKVHTVKPNLTTTINIHKEDEASQSEA